MAIADIHQRIKQILYGQGLGEAPSLRRAAANANEGLTGQVANFDVLAGEGAKIKAGNTLSAYTTVAADMHVFYVLPIATDTITVVNAYLGSPAIVGSDSGDLDNFVLEQNPIATNFEIDEAIDTIMANMLWPQVYDVVEATITTPDLVDGQEGVVAEAEWIHYAYQIIGPTAVPIHFTPQTRTVATAIVSTGKLATFQWINATTGYYQYRAKFAEADEADTELTRLIALGAAALLLGGALIEAAIEGTKKDNVEAISQRQAIGSSLWRDFLTLRQGMSEELGRRLPNQIIVNRG